MPEHRYINWKDNELHSVACDCCKSTLMGISHTRADGMKVTECSTCGLAYLNPRPLDHLIDRFYEAEYFTEESTARGIGLTIRKNDKNEMIIGNFTEDELRPITLMETKAGTFTGKEILEIGCETGTY